MKIKLSKDYSRVKMMHEYDRKYLREGSNLTITSVTSGYDVTWEDVDVTKEQLEEYASKGYAIRINC